MYDSSFLFFLAAFISIVVGTVAGFGTSTIFLPIALIFLDFKTALVLVAVAHLSGNVGATTFFRHGLDKKLILLFGIPSILLTILGAYLVSYVPQNVLITVLGFCLLLFSLVFLLKPDFKVAANRANTIFGGALSGILQGLIGIGGPIRGAFLISYNLDKYKYIATLAALAVVIDLTRIPIYFTNNLLETQYYYYIPVLIFLGIIGSYIGKKLVNLIPQDKFKNLVLIAVAIASIILILAGYKS
jgi:uncharacterized membrane protein YfcA